MSMQAFVEPFFFSSADGTAIANTTTETLIFSNVTIPGNYMFYPGRMLRVKIYGKLSTTGTPTITFLFRLGGAAGTLLATTDAITNGSGITNLNWRVDALIQCRTTGSAGSLLVMGDVMVMTSTTTASVSQVFGVSGGDAPAPVSSLNIAADWTLSATAVWSAASASNTLTGLMMVVESLN